MIRALFIEDTPHDMALVLRQLKKENLEIEAHRVDSIAALEAALDQKWDIILSDFNLPGFTTVEVLAVLRVRKIKTPVIVVSGEVADGEVVLLMRNGAADFVRKENLSRLAPAMLRELETANEQVRQQEQFRHLADAMPQIVWTADGAGELDYFNQVWFDFSGTTYEANVGHGWAAAVHPDDLPSTLVNWRQALASSNNYTNEFRLLRRDGIYRWHLARAVPVKDASGMVLKWYGTNTDIHEQKLVANELRETQARLELAMKGAGIGTWFYDPVTLRIKGSKNAAGILGTTVSEGLMSNILEKLIHPDDRERVTDQLAAAVRGHHDYFDEYRVVFPQTGEVHWLRSMAKWPDRETSKMYGMAGIIYDFTAEKLRALQIDEARSAAEAANLAKSQFLANVSHEIRTPLGVIMGFAELALDQQVWSDEVAEYLRVIKRNGQMLTRMLGDVLDLSKIEARRIEIEQLRFHLPSTLEEIASSLRLQAAEKGIQLVMEPSANLPSYVSTDPTRLRQILVNLIGNAIKFTERGEVRITIDFAASDANSPSTLKFTITDTGIGLTKEQQERLFAPFTQADPSMTRRYGGTGLGLALARELARLLNGNIEIVRSELGVGSTFVCTLTVAEVSGQNRAATPGLNGDALAKAAPRPQVLAGVRILLVEDAIDNQVLFSRYLKHAGAIVEIASDGAEGVAKAMASLHDVVLMDIQMPVLNGHQATAELRRRGFTTPIVALTAHALKEERDQAMREGFTDYLTKPLDRTSLIDTLTRLTNSATIPPPGPLGV